MEPIDVRRAVDAARATARALGLEVDEAVVVHNSDRIAVRLLPCDVLARVAPTNWRVGMEFEAEVARRLTEIQGPVGELEPRVEPGVYLRDGFSMTLWTYYEPAVNARGSAAHEQLGMSSDLPPADYAQALYRLHAGLRTIDLAAPHITLRVEGWTRDVADHTSTPDLRHSDRNLISDTLRRTSAAMSGWGSGGQLLHGEPHPGNLLSTRRGPLFVDVGTCQRGPVEYDLAYVPEVVAEHYPRADQDILRQCRILMWAGVTTMRWGRDDQYPDRDHWRIEALNQLRAALNAALETP
jgi:hypothetical protein